LIDGLMLMLKDIRGNCVYVLYVYIRYILHRLHIILYIIYRKYGHNLRLAHTRPKYQIPNTKKYQIHNQIL
jgi:hypothetical protein